MRSLEVREGEQAISHRRNFLNCGNVAAAADLIDTAMVEFCFLAYVMTISGSQPNGKGRLFRQPLLFRM